MKVRLNKYLRDSGLCSRRKADLLISSGKVFVDGRVIREMGAKVDPDKQAVEVDGHRIEPPKDHLYGLLNKPFGVVSTMKDPEGRPCVGDLLKPIKRKVFLVGRLDFDTMGLLPFTSDGKWAQRLMHPSFHVPRTYKAVVEGTVTPHTLQALKKGVMLTDGPTIPAKATILEYLKGRTVVRITVFEGRNRLVRRMFEAVGHRVIHLIRTGFGPFSLGDLKVGEYRLLKGPVLITKGK